MRWQAGKRICLGVIREISVGTSSRYIKSRFAAGQPGDIRSEFLIRWVRSPMTCLLRLLELMLAVYSGLHIASTIIRDGNGEIRLEYRKKASMECTESIATI